MYQYQKTSYQRRRRTSDYLKPFLMVFVLILIVFGAWKVVQGIFVNENRSTFEECAAVNIESGTVKAMSSGQSAWQSLPDGVPVCADEKLQTGTTGRVILTAFDQSIIRMDNQSELEFLELKKKNDTRFIQMMLLEGSAWFGPTAKTDDSTFTVSTDLMKVNANGGRFALEAPGKLYAIEGELAVDLMLDKEVIKTIELGVGQQLMITPAILEDIENGLNKDIIFALSDGFKNSDWYRWNSVKDGVLTAEDLPEDEGTENEDEDIEDDEEDPSEETEEQTDDDEDEDTPNNNNVTLSTPKITNPSAASSGKVEIKSTAQAIEGTVSSATERVIVNGYTLTLFKPGDTTFRYTASTELGNLSVGENTYNVYAEDEDGNRSQAATVILVLPQSVVNESPEETEDSEAEEADEETTSSPSGSVVIQSPNGGSDYTTRDGAFSITGSVPQETVKVSVNNYQLQGFVPGAGFKYNLNPEFGNIVEGSNTYTVNAYDKDDNLLGSDSINIIFNKESNNSNVDTEANPQDTSQTPATETEGGSQPPIITLPSASGTYQTDLSEIVIGGSVGSGVDKVFLNGQFVAGYAPGSAQWSKNVTLQEGQNVFTVSGEKDGLMLGGGSITITYQP